MRMMPALAASLAAALALSGCQTPQQQNAFTGGALGMGAGSLIGAAVSNGNPGAALAGAAIGAASGAMIGAAATPTAPAYGYYAPPPPPGGCARWGYDYYGNRVCIAYY